MDIFNWQTLTAFVCFMMLMSVLLEQTQRLQRVENKLAAILKHLNINE